MERYGYIRVSAKDQNPERQFLAMQEQQIKQKNISRLKEYTKECMELQGVYQEFQQLGKGQQRQQPLQCLHKERDVAHTRRVRVALPKESIPNHYRKV